MNESEILAEFEDKMKSAYTYLEALAKNARGDQQEFIRLTAKAEGVRLCHSYLMDYKRLLDVSKSLTVD